MLTRISTTFFAFLAFTLTLWAQTTDPEPVNSPQRQVTFDEAAENGDAGGMTLIVIGAIVVLLVVVLLFMRRKKTPTVNRLHKY